MSTESLASWTMLFAWTPPAQHDRDPLDPPSGTVAFPPHLVPTNSVRTLPLETRARAVRDVWVPCLAGGDAPLVNTLLQNSPTEDWREACAALMEYIGLAAASSPRLQTYDRCEPSLAQYHPIDPSAEGSLLHLCIRGIFTPALADAIVQRIEASLKRHAKQHGPPHTGSWAAVTLSGFPDTPVAWRSRNPGLGLALGSGLALYAPETQPSPPAHKARRKGTVRRGETEHGILRTGENGWSALLFQGAPTDTLHRTGTLFVESLELDTRN